MFWLGSLVHGLMTAPAVTVGIIVLMAAGLYVLGKHSQKERDHHTR